MIINVTDDASNVIKGKVGNGLNLFLTLRVRVILLRTGVGHGFIIFSGLSWYPRVIYWYPRSSSYASSSRRAYKIGTGNVYLIEKVSFVNGAESGYFQLTYPLKGPVKIQGHLVSVMTAVLSSMLIDRALATATESSQISHGVIES